MIQFEAIVGNPPYQVMDGGNSASAIPVYNKFVNLARLIGPNYISMIMPAKWYNGGRNLDEFRKSMLNDRYLVELHDFIDSHECFTNVDIAGGICYFLWDSYYNGNCKVFSHNHGKILWSIRDLRESETFIRYSEALQIIKKVKQNSNTYFSDRVFPQRPFGLRTYVKPSESGDIILRYNKGKGPFDRKSVILNSNLIGKWKVITSYRTNEHAGETDKEGKKRILSTTEILPPNEICTETYLLVDYFETEEEATNCLIYMKTLFFRFMLSMVVSTQGLSASSFSLVPYLDFHESWTDEKLYAKYGITPEEQAYIESLIKPME
jgi:site-specific DNA-methyltransferase (adenine-specific)